jgi:hypothetical protein
MHDPWFLLLTAFSMHSVLLSMHRLVATAAGMWDHDSRQLPGCTHKAVLLMRWA